MRDDGYPEVLEARRLGRRRSPVNGLQDLAHCHSGTAVAGTGRSAVTTGRKETLRRQKAPTRQTTGASAIFSSARETYLSLINRWVRSYFSIISASGRRRTGKNSLRCVTWAHPLSVERTRDVEERPKAAHDGQEHCSCDDPGGHGALPSVDDHDSHDDPARERRVLQVSLPLPNEPERRDHADRQADPEQHRGPLPELDEIIGRHLEEIKRAAPDLDQRHRGRQEGPGIRYHDREKRDPFGQFVQSEDDIRALPCL